MTTNGQNAFMPIRSRRRLGPMVTEPARHEPGGWLTCLLACVIFGVVLCCSAGEPLAATIAEDTVWSGEMRITEKVVVEEGATLLIMPGTRLVFEPIPKGAEKGGGRLIIFGTLVAQGSRNKPILFSIVPEADRDTSWEGIRFEQADAQVSRIAFSRFERARAAISGRGSQLQIEQSEFCFNTVGIVAHSGLAGGLFDCLLTENGIGIRFEGNEQLRVVNSRFEKNQDGGVHCSNSLPTIRNCVFEENGPQGIACLRGSSPLIEDCLIKGHKQGIRADMNSSPVILNNDLVDNDTAVCLERRAFAIIDSNLITNNRVGIFCNLGGYPLVKQNNLADNRDFAIELGANQSAVVARMNPFERRIQQNLSLPTEVDVPGMPSIPVDGSIDARHNWWGKGTLDKTTENARVIADGHDTPTVNFRGKAYPKDMVSFTPWAEQPFSTAGRRIIHYSGIEGRVCIDEQTIAGTRVAIYNEEEKAAGQQWLTYSPPTDENGHYALFLPPGNYLVTVLSATDMFEAEIPPSEQSLVRVQIDDATTSRIDLCLTHLGVDPKGRLSVCSNPQGR